ncbi:GntR family transcriptional regulator [Oceanobacillus sp. J11TS1]|uniref:GntR family transcriptional regulator n=1 Tax=Oceanobacillus sp. J11TS1 TaxID=2807191 RepID=UPI001B157422|nr:GntR family transcriptional regulator [Oceanobacillus sp. J11TS1]GIO23651.1 GntR family transcriptional regulator [Oceanobacillus sp. J11TS1]
MGRIIKTESLHLQAYNLIKESIMEGELQPNERVIEAKIAAKLGVSRGTIREAIRMLIQDGLLIYNNGLVRVYQPTVQDIVDIFQCRESLETLAARLALRNFSEDIKNQLAENLKETKEVEKDSRKLGQLDQQFHTIIIEASKNKQLIELLETIKSKIHYMRKSMVGGEFYPAFIEEHERIYMALIEGDEERLLRIISRHIKRALGGVMRHINSKSKEEYRFLF